MTPAAVPIPPILDLEPCVSDFGYRLTDRGLRVPLPRYAECRKEPRRRQDKLL